MPEPSSKSPPVSLLHVLIAIVLVLSFIFTGAGYWLCSFFKGDYGFFGVFESPPPVSQNVSDLPLFDYSGEIHTLSGRPVPVSAMKDKIVFIHFWATWCPPCLKELPDIQKLFNEMKTVPNFHFAMITNENQEKVQEFMRQKKYRFPVYLSGQFLFKRLNVDSIPATFIIDSTGKVVFKLVGSAKWDDKKLKKFAASLSS